MIRMSTVLEADDVVEKYFSQHILQHDVSRLFHGHAHESVHGSCQNKTNSFVVLSTPDVFIGHTCVGLHEGLMEYYSTCQRILVQEMSNGC